MPVITPPAIGHQEAEAKRWYQAEAIRKVMLDLNTVYNEIEPDSRPKALVAAALEGLVKAKMLLAPPPKPAKQQRPQQY